MFLRKCVSSREINELSVANYLLVAVGNYITNIARIANAVQCLTLSVTLDNCQDTSDCHELMISILNVFVFGFVIGTKKSDIIFCSSFGNFQKVSSPCKILKR